MAVFIINPDQHDDKKYYSQYYFTENRSFPTVIAVACHDIKCNYLYSGKNTIIFISDIYNKGKFSYAFSLAPDFIITSASLVPYYPSHNLLIYYILGSIDPLRPIEYNKKLPEIRY